MAKKPSLTTITTGYASTTALNDNFEALRDAFDNTLSRDGSTPNTLLTDIDMNSNDILNAGKIMVGGDDYLALSLQYKNAAETAQAGAETAETNAETSETNAASSATSASSSASSASTSATTAQGHSSDASTAKTAAETAQAAAETAQTAAETAETNAETAETNASASATSASSSASSASTSATNAAASATSVGNSETNAAASATAAAASQVSAATSAASALSTYDLFDDRYLGSKTSEPTVDNDGDALVAGALYFNSSENEMRAYDGTVWIAASSAGTASLLEYFYTATSSQTTFSGSDSEGNTLSYTAGNLLVILNGIILDSTADYTATNGTSIVLTTGATAVDEMHVIAFKAFTSADMVSKSNGGTFLGNVDFSNGADVTGNITVTGTVDGRDVASDGTKLDGIESGATADQTGAEIKTAYEANTNTNAFTDTDHTKLDGIEAGATADQSASEILTAIKTVDGSGSGLDADKLDGNHASAFLTGNQTITLSGDLSGSGTTSISAQIGSNKVGATELNVSGNGTSGQALTSDGDGTFSWADAGGAWIANDQTFTSSGTWTKPSLPSDSPIRVRLWGAGGGGGCDSTSRDGGGGNGGGFAEWWGELSDLSSTESVTVGAGGSSTSSSLGTGGTGGNSYFGTKAGAAGGNGGTYNGSASTIRGAPMVRNWNNTGWESVANNTEGPQDAAGLWHGGQGGYGSSFSRGQSVFWGGGGGGLSDSTVSDVYAAGRSVMGGDGGKGSWSGNASAGSVPGGGGGGAKSSDSSGAGGRGEVQVTVFSA